MNWKRLVVGFLIVFVLSAAGLWGYNNFLAPEADESDANGVDLTAVSLDTAIDQVLAEGIVLPLADAQLAFQARGQLIEIAISEGEFVTEGAVLMRLDPTDQEIGLVQAEAAVMQAQANVETAVAGLLAAQTGVEAAQINVAATEAQLALVQAGPTEAQIEVSDKTVAAAEAAIVQAAGSRDVALENASSGAVLAAEAQLSAAQAQYDAALIAYQPILQDEELDDADLVEQAQLQLTAAQANLAAAQAALNELLAGARAGERTAVTAGVTVASNQRDVAQSQLDLLLSGAKLEQVAVAEARVVQAETAVLEAELRVVNGEAAIEQANAALIEAEAVVVAAQSALEKRTLTAPFSGTVASIPIKIGQQVAPGVPVLILADMSGWKIETTDLTELSVVTVEPGYEVDVAIDAFPGETLTGQLLDVSNSSELVRGDVTYVVTIGLEDALSLPLRWGMTAFVTIEVEQ